MATEFDRSIAAVPRACDPATYDVELDPGWQIGAGINGGLVLAAVGNAVRCALAHAPGPTHADPVAISAYYLSPTRPGPASVSTRVLRAGRSMSTVSATLSQVTDGGTSVDRVSVLATYGRLAGLPDGVHTSLTPPDLPPVEECLGSAAAPPSFVGQAPLLERLDLRLDPACAGWAAGAPSGQGLIEGWLRLADARAPDPLMLLLAADALPPVTFDLGLMGWTPTLELTVHVRALPAPGWLRVRHQTRNHAGGMLEEDADVWDSAGRLVAQSRQLALVPR